MKRRELIAAGLAAFVAPVRAAQSAMETITGGEAISGDRFTVDGGEFILADIIAPPLYHFGDQEPAHFGASRIALQSMLGSTLAVKDAAPASRWGARVVHALVSSDSLQEMLVSKGAVRVAPQSKDHKLIARLLGAEAEARAARRGLWALGDYAVFDAASARRAVGAHHLIEGEVTRAAKGGARFYLNFGEDFREDFTAGATSRLQKSWAKSGVDLAALQGARLRVRGFVEMINGPSIDLKHPLQIERVDARTS